MRVGGTTLNDLDAPHPGGGDTAREDLLDAAVASARAGDESGFSALWQALHPPLLRYLTVRGDDAPEDVAAETWLHVVRGLGDFQGGGAEFRAWLFTIARHRAVDQGRTRARRPRTVSSDDTDQAGQVGRDADHRDTAPSAEHHVLEQEGTAWALRLVSTLPPAQAEMVTLRVVAGLEVADVARLVGKRPGTVRVTVHRALKTLGDSLQDHPRHPTARPTPRKAM